MSKRSKSHREAPEMGAMLARMMRAMVKRAGEGDLDAVVELVKLDEQLRDAITAAGAGAHAFGYSFTEIADAVGISRQGARQRFGVGLDERSVDRRPS